MPNLGTAPIQRFPIAIEEDSLSGFLKFDRTVEGHLITSEWKVSSVLLSYNALFAGDRYPQIFPRTLPLPTSARVLSVLWAEGRADGGKRLPGI